MIIFYQNDGKIVGSISGRMHSKEELNMWIGDADNRLIVNWVKQGDKFIPEQQPIIFNRLENHKANLYDYKVKNNKLVKS